MISRRLKGKWSLWRIQGFHSALSISFTLRRHSISLSQWYNIHSYFIYQWGEIKKGLSKSPFLAINAKGGESFKPKAKGPHHLKISKKLNNVFSWYLVIVILQIGIIFSIGISFFKTSISIYFQLVSIKTLLKTKRSISFRESFI
jgi:hypothetical protein